MVRHLRRCERWPDERCGLEDHLFVPCGKRRDNVYLKECIGIEPYTQYPWQIEFLTAGEMKRDHELLHAHLREDTQFLALV